MCVVESTDRSHTHPAISMTVDRYRCTTRPIDSFFLAQSHLKRRKTGLLFHSFNQSLDVSECLIHRWSPHTTRKVMQPERFCKKIRRQHMHLASSTVSNGLDCLPDLRPLAGFLGGRLLVGVSGLLRWIHKFVIHVGDESPFDFLFPFHR